MSIRITMDKLAATILTYDCTSIHHANANETGRTESSKSAMERCELSRRCGLAFIPAHSMRCGIAGKLSRLPVASLGWPSFRHRANLTFSQSRKRCPPGRFLPADGAGISSADHSDSPRSGSGASPHGTRSTPRSSTNQGFSLFFRIAQCRHRNSYPRRRFHPGLLP